MGTGQGSVDVHQNCDTARGSECSIVQGKGGLVLHVRCRAGSCAVGEGSMRARAGTQCTLLASTAHARHGQSEGHGGAYGRRGRLLPVGRRGRCL
jgi:hypothetical protein